MDEIRFSTKRMRFSLISNVILIALFLLYSQSFAQPLADGKSKFLGNVIGFSIPSSWDSYWNQMTPENSGKWGSVEVGRDNYSWGGLDLAYDHAKQRGLPFKFHTLIWGQQQPTWITTLNPDEQKEEIEEWIRLVGERYPEIDYIDVVNEPLPNHAPAPYREAMGGAGVTGWDWVIWAFEKARHYLPNAKLILNEYNILNSAGNTTTMLQIINLLHERGLIDGIGIQGHRFELESAATNLIQSNLDRLAATGLPINISEFDLGNVNNAGTPDDNQQLQAYQRVFPVLWEHPGIEGITLWGYIEGQIWQTTCFLQRSNGTERPALQWLREYLTTGNIRSAQSGNWNDASTWEKYNGSEWIAAANAPVVNDVAILIRDGHTVTVTENDSADQVVVSQGATLVINTGVTFLAKNGEGDDLIVKGALENFGSVVSEASANINFVSGTYVHAQEVGSIPIATWGASSTCEITNYITGAKPANLNQNFGNFTWDCAGQTSNVDWGWFNNTIGGNITVKTTGSARAQMTSPGAGTPNTITIYGGINVEAGQFTSNGSGSVAEITLHTYGDVNVTGGNFSVSRGSGPIVTWYLYGDFSMANATTQNSKPDGAKFIFAKEGEQTLTLGAGNTLTALPIEVNSGAILNMGSSVLAGSGIFKLNAGATLGTANPSGIDSTIKTTGNITLSKEAGYAFNGSTAQVTGASLPDTVRSLIINNSAGVALSHAVTVTNTLEMKKGALQLGGHALSYEESAVLKYSGSTAQVTTDAELPESGGPHDLIIANPRGVTLHASRHISGYLGFADFGDLVLDSDTLTVGSISNASTSQYVKTGNASLLKIPTVGSNQVLFPVGTNTAYSPVWITNSGTTDTIGVRVKVDATAPAQGGRVNVQWDIAENTPGGGNYTIQFGWMPLHESGVFKRDPENNAKIFLMSDTTEAGSGDYTANFSTEPRTLARAEIFTLGPFAIGLFKLATGIEREIVRPTEFSLSQNYPNPFNPTTTIKYTLTTASNVRMVIYNTLGDKVRTLVSFYQNRGEHAAVWDAKDDNNIQVASGIYFYRLKAGTFILQKKMVLVR